MHAWVPAIFESLSNLFVTCVVLAKRMNVAASRQSHIVQQLKNLALRKLKSSLSEEIIRSETN